VRLIAPAYVKPFVKRQKNDMADAAAIAEAASRPTMRFVAVKREAQQAAAMAYRTRDLLVRPRTQTINALRAHLAERGIVAPTGPAHVGRLAAAIDGDDGILPAAVRDLARLLLDQIAGLAEKIAGLDSELRKRVTTDDAARRPLSELGHEVRLISPQFVTPYVKSNKNDRNDAEAICEAVGRPSMRFVPQKSPEQLEIQAVHRIRQRLISDRTRLVNQIRGLLAEHGVVIARDISRLRPALHFSVNHRMKLTSVIATAMMVR
jgi:transposase